MADLDDKALLQQFAEHESEQAFVMLVERHVDLVFSVAMRRVGNAHSAEEVVQAVFIILARKAKSLSAKTVLPGWLYHTTHLTAGNYLRGEIRRQKREQEAYMSSLLNEPEPEDWTQIAPRLEEAMAGLRASDRDAIVLRFFENKSLRDVGTALGTSEDAAKMRVNRALEKLRKFFAKRGVSLSAAAIAGAVSANSVQAAPVALKGTITAAAMKGPAVAVSTMALVKGTLKTMIYSKVKLALGCAAAILLTAGAINVAVSRNGGDDSKTTVGEATAQEHGFANELMKATADGDYATFISHGDSDFKTLPKSEFQKVSKQVSKDLKAGYHVVFLGGLQQDKSHITLWKIAYDKNNDDDLLTMSVQNGKIGGATLTPPFH